MKTSLIAPSLATEEDSQKVKRVPATANQSRYVIAELSGNGSYMIAMGHFVRDRFDEARFERACMALVRRHEVLRSRFELRDGGIDAVISQAAEFRYHAFRMSDRSFEAFRTWALPKVFDDVDPSTPGALVRFLVADYGEAWRFTIAAHHAITDGFSRGVMSRELLKLYAAEDLALANSYYDVASPTEPSPQTALEVSKLVKKLPNSIRFFGEGASQCGAEAAGLYVERAFEDLSKPVRSLAKRADTTRFGVFAAAYGLSLHGVSGEAALSSFFQSEGRKAIGASNSIVGPFSNTLPLDLSVDLDQTFATFARQISERTRAVLDLEQAPFMEALASAGKAPTVSLNMFPPATRIMAGDLDVGPREFLDRRTEYDLNLVWAEDRGVLRGRAFYDARQLTEARAQAFLEMHERLLRAAIADPERTCRDLLQDARAGSEIVMPRLPAGPDPERRLHEAIFDQAVRTPDATAIFTSAERITYASLVEGAQAVTAGLASAGAGAGDRVAILARRCPQMVAAMLGVSASGGSFAIIDAGYPAARIEAMLGALGARFLIEAGADLPGIAAKGVLRVTPEGNASHPLVTGPPRQIAYHLFTSGTTGKPKLVSHPEQTLQRFVAWQAGLLDLDRPVTMMMAGLSHDPVMRDIFLPLTVGGSLAIPTEAEMFEPYRLRGLMEDAAVNVLHLTPAAGRLLTIGEAEPRPWHLRAVFWGGDRLPQRLVETWHLRMSSCRQFNLYGTTETPQAALIHEIDPGVLEQTVPLGRPVPWTGASLIAQDGRPVALGELGEIVIDLADPVTGASGLPCIPADGPAVRHHTGDFGFATDDGLIRYAGRRDDQVQINGYRVELSEIDAATERVEGIDQACAVMDRDEPGELALFAVSRDADASQAAVLSALARDLPGYMVPKRVQFVKRLPLTPNGKVDRDALLEIHRQSAAGAEDHGTETPYGDDERTVAELLSEHSGLPVASRDKSLADLGADSLSTIGARLDLEKHGFVLPEGWEWLTVAELARCRPGAPKSGSWLREYLHASRIDTFIVVRCLAIVFVVSLHSDVLLNGGGSVLLFAMAGFGIGRLQLPAVLRDGKTGRIWALVAKLLIPLVPASIGLFAVHTAIGDDPHIATLLLYENVSKFIDQVILHRGNAQHHVVWLWFLHAYLQIFVGLGIVLGVPRIHRWVSANIWRSAWAFFLVSEALCAGVLFVGASATGDKTLASALLSHAPTSVLPFFALGILASAANGLSRKALVIALALMHYGASHFLFEMHEQAWWLIGLILCLVLPYVSLPRIVATVVVVISAQALMIYLTHRPTLFAIRSAAGDVIPTPVAIAIELAVGVALGTAMRPLLKRLGIERISNRRVMFGGPSRTINDQTESGRLI